MQMLPPAGYVGEPASSFATTFVHMSWNKVRLPSPPHAGALPQKSWVWYVHVCVLHA